MRPTVAELARLNTELERIKLAIATANEAIGQRRELSKVEQQQARALTAAESNVIGRTLRTAAEPGRTRTPHPGTAAGCGGGAALEMRWPRSNVNVRAEQVFETLTGR